MSAAETFGLDKSSRWLFLAAPWIMVAFAALSASVPFLPDDGKPRNEPFILGLAIVCFLGFGLGAWYSWKIVRRLPEAAISLDEEGLWPSIHSRGTALVRWSTIARLRERPFLQRIEALDTTGNVLARLEYQLQNFERLRSIVLQRAQLQRVEVPMSGAFQKSWWHHVFSIGSMISFALLGWYVGSTQPVLGYLGMAGVVGMIAWEYWVTPYALQIRRDALEVCLPGRRRNLPRQHIARVEIMDETVNHAKHPAVAVQLVGESKPIKLKSLGAPAIELHQALQAWLRGDA